MAKRVIQLYDKYKSTTKVYPLIIGECLTDDAKETIKGLSPEVIANVTLAGTEAELTSLQIGDTKYSIPQGGGGSQLYQHNFFIMQSETRVTITIINTISTAMAYNDLVSYLSSKGFTSNRKCVLAVGWHQNQNDNNWTDLIVGAYTNNSTLYISWFRGSSELYSNVPSSTTTVFEDTVIEL